jgi:nicotinate-nucleotide adenylyltransferase
LDEDVSATGIRERLRVGVSCGTMLSPTVGLYIARMHLYHA